MSIKGVFIRLFYKLPISMSAKEKILKKRRQIIGYKEIVDNKIDINVNDDTCKQYVKQVLGEPSLSIESSDYVPLSKKSFERKKEDIKLFAFYLTQYCPTKENDEWWGKGTTEWNNVVRAVPQFVGHNQPRLADELGYYDLRIPDVMRRQIELAKQYGIYGFCFYYYWFGGNKRILEKPMNMFLEHKKDMDFPFFYCWANHNWYKKFQGTSDEVLVEMPNDENVYKQFIDQIMPDLKDSRYYKINNKPVIIIYSPSSVPDSLAMIEYWNEKARKNGFSGIYAIAVQESGTSEDYTKYGYDAACEFHPTTFFNLLSLAETNVKPINKYFSGKIYDYEKIVDKKIYNQYHPQKLYKSVMAFWDNTPRKDFRAQIFTNESLSAYKTWLKDVIAYNRVNTQLDDNIAFINAWNEWGEGAYLEPDKKYGYGLLQSTRESIEESRKS